MKPILICQFYPAEGPGFFSTYLDEQALPWECLRLDQGESLPQHLNDHSALVMMGGPMSANDSLPWIAPLLDLIQHAQSKQIPVLGHCLGGQLIAKALGAKVSANPVREIGWGLVTPSTTALAKCYFDEQPFNAFHWHGETFSLPEGAHHLLASAYCDNQAFAIGNTLALQCHIEMTSDMVREWCIEDADYHAQALSNSPAAESAANMQQNLDDKIEQLQHKARAIYQQWLQPLS